VNVVLALRKLRQEDDKANLAYIARPKTKTTKNLRNLL
jgi:hypothetical protein